MVIEKLFEKYSDELTYAMVSFCNNEALAQDSRQHAFLQGLRNKQKKEAMPEKAAKAWFFSVARNYIINEYKKQKPLMLTDESDVFESPSLDSFSHVDMLSLLDNLSSPKKEIVILKYYNHLNATQIGKALAMKPSTVRYHLSQALHQLRMLL